MKKRAKLMRADVVLAKNVSADMLGMAGRRRVKAVEPKPPLTSMKEKAQEQLFKAMGGQLNWSFSWESDAGSQNVMQRSEGLLRLMEKALEQGADPNVPMPTSNTQETPLIMAAGHGWDDVCELLLEYGADAEKLSRKKETALMAAAEWGNVDVVRVLSLQPGLLMRDLSGRSALSIAAGGGAVECLDCIAGAMSVAMSPAEFWGELRQARLAAVSAGESGAVETLDPWLGMALVALEKDALGEVSKPGAARGAPRI